MDKCFFNLLHKRYRNDGIPIITLNNLQLETLKTLLIEPCKSIYELEKAIKQRNSEINVNYPTLHRYVKNFKRNLQI